MNHPVSSPDLRAGLDELAKRARRTLARWAFARDLRVTSSAMPAWLLVVPVALFITQTGLVLVGRAPLAWPVWIWAALALAGPVLFLVVRLAWLARGRRHDRLACLGTYDRQLDTRDRLVTADEFLSSDRAGRAFRPGDPGDAGRAFRPGDSGDVGRAFRPGDPGHVGRAFRPGDPGGAEAPPYMDFKAAAIEDAAEHAARALGAALAPRPLPPWSVPARQWAAVPAAVAIVFAALWLGRVATAIRATPDAASGPAAADLDTLPAKVVARVLGLLPPPPRPERRPAAGDTAASASLSSPDQSDPANRSPQEAEGASQSGGQANSRSSSQSMSSPGTPSNQQTPSPPLGEDPLQNQPKPTATPPRRSDAAKTPQQASSATSGQGQSKSSSTDQTAIPSADQPDRAGANKDDGPDEAGIQDEVEEEKTTGVERPSLRKNKPPVDRNLSPRPTGDQPNPDANGRSGPGGRKKTRGVPSMILGVPTPDRIQGMTNPGRSKVTQENAAPKEEPQAAVAALARQAREAAFGHIEHPLLRSWMLTLVEQYFLQVRGKVPAPPPSAKDRR
jgi:hypothetical protein